MEGQSAGEFKKRGRGDGRTCWCFLGRPQAKSCSGTFFLLGNEIARATLKCSSMHSIEEAYEFGRLDRQEFRVALRTRTPIHVHMIRAGMAGWLVGCAGGGSYARCAVFKKEQGVK